MGKPRRKDGTNNSGHPTSKTIKPPSDPELAATRERQILPIISELTSPDATNRSSAAIAIANIVSDTKCRKLLLREQIVQILLDQTIADSAFESKSAGWGILRSLAAEEDADFCIHLYRHNILAAIQGISQIILDTIESQEYPISKLPETQQNLVWVLCSSVIGLMSSLAAAQDEILEALSKSPVIINLCFSVLGFDGIPQELFSETLTCLATLTEDNEQVAKQITDHESWLKGLLQLRELGGSKAVTACGVLHNIFAAMQWFDHNTPSESFSDAVLIPTLVRAMDAAQNGADLSNASSYSSPDRIMQLALEITASIATSLQEALEHAGNNEEEFEGFGDDVDVSGDAMAEDGSEIGDEEQAAPDNQEMDEEEMDADMELVAGSDLDEEDESTDSQPTLDALIRIATPAVLLIAKNSGSNEAIGGSALSALNNIAWTISSIDFTASQSSRSRVWVGLAQRIWSEIVSPVLSSNTVDIALASSVTSISWAVARSIPGKLKLGPEDHRKFMALYQASKTIPPSGTKSHANGNSTKVEGKEEDAFQALGVKSIGILGRLALHPAPITMNREIGIFLLTILSALPETPSADAVEALDQLFDIYADGEYDYDAPVFWGDGLYKHLEAIVPKARKMAKSVDKRKYGELRQRADEAVMNLGRFLAYKRKEKAGA